MSLPIIIDTDPGQDDAIAILLALGSPELDVRAIVAVAGNVPLALTEKNARKICTLAGRCDIPVYAGCDRPLLRPLVTAEEVHGKTGLDGPVLSEPEMALNPMPGVEAIVQILRHEPAGTLTICALGPLTNIAAALILAPDIAVRIKQIVAMGGGFFEGGNVTPTAEFNFYVDPEAARIVLGAGIPVILAPLDVTHQALTTPARIEQFRTMPNRCGPVTAQLLAFFERFDVNKYGSEGGPLHDPCVIAWLLQPDLFTGRDCAVEIDTRDGPTLGMSIIDFWHVTKAKPNVHVLRHVNAAGFFDLLAARIAHLP